MTKLSRVELAQPADATRIAEMSRSLIEDGLTWRWRRSAIARLIHEGDSSVVVAREHARIVGFGAMKFSFGISTGHLLLLAVEPGRRRDGIGSEIIAWFEKVARLGRIERIMLEVRAKSLDAHTFYERFGFHKSQRLPGYYERREDAVRMEWKLS